MKTPIYRTTDPEFETRWKLLLARGDESDTSNIEVSVRAIVDKVRFRKDAALIELTNRLDKRDVREASELEINRSEWKDAAKRLDPELLAALTRAADRIRRFHVLQAVDLNDRTMTDDSGARVTLAVRPLQRVGIYVPGGTAAYPSTVLMNAIPAKVAGVEEVIMTTPATGGVIRDVVLAAADLAGVDRLFTVGGAQAVSALAFGTPLIPAVDKIVGPGNAWVAEAKRQVFGTVDIDEIAGPSEVLIIADDGADPAVVASDMLAQAEHDVRAAALMITWFPEIAKSTAAAADEQCQTLPRKAEVTQAIETRGGVILATSEEEAFELANLYASEHLGLATREPRASLAKVKNAGAVFVGHHAPEALGDYNAGCNHVLPTGGSARYGSPLSVHDFVRRMNIIEIEPTALEALGPDAALLAREEGLEAHARAIEARL